MARRKRSKRRNPPTPWLKYALIAGGCYFAYRFLKDKGILGENGDDYAPYEPSPEVKQIGTTLKRTPIQMFRSAPGPVVKLQEKQKAYDITYEQYKKAPVATAQAQAAYDSAQAKMNALKARAEQLRAEAQAKGVDPRLARAKNIEATKKEMEASAVKTNVLPKLKDEVRVKQSLEKLPAQELRKLEGELTEAAKVKEVNDFLRAAAIAVGEGAVAAD